VTHDVSADVVVIGAGIMGLSVAYHLAEQGVANVIVVDKTYLCGGASGRNGGGVRAQWSSETNVVLMQESIRMCREFARLMKINVWFRQGGYLFLARTDDMRKRLEASVTIQRECGVRTEMLTPAAAVKIVPELDATQLVAASYNPDDGVVFPWPFVWGFANAAEKRGVKVLPFHEVIGLRVRGTTIESVVLRNGDRELSIATNRVVNAAGAWSPAVAQLVGVALPNKPHRHEICSSEPLKPWLRPLVADLADGLYFSQSTRGELVGGIGQSYVPPGLNQESSFAFLGKYARSLARTCPALGAVKILRQWAGCYDLTPDANPIFGPVKEVDEFYQVSGFMGHGFMMAPVIGKRLAQHLAKGTDEPLFERWRLSRFAEGKMLSEGMILG
jgi:sarcosine oxidase subunit beta